MSNAAPARLTSALLARKGHAVPAAFSQSGPLTGATSFAGDRPTLVAPAIVPPPAAPAAAQRAPVPAAPLHVAQAPCANAEQPALSAAPQARSRVRMTLRAREELRLKLKLSAQHLRRSMNDVITEAVTRYLEQLGPEVVIQDWVRASLLDGRPRS